MALHVDADAHHPTGWPKDDVVQLIATSWDMGRAEHGPFPNFDKRGPALQKVEFVGRNCNGECKKYTLGGMQSVYAALRKDIGPHCFAPRMYLAQDREESLAGISNGYELKNVVCDSAVASDPRQPVEAQQHLFEAVYFQLKSEEEGSQAPLVLRAPAPDLDLETSAGEVAQPASAAAAAAEAGGAAEENGGATPAWAIKALQLLPNDKVTISMARRQVEREASNHREVITREAFDDFILTAVGERGLDEERVMELQRALGC
jgi:hypothetical protein